MAAFYLEHNVSRHVATLLRLAGHQATTAREIGLEEANDEEHLLVAARYGWILVSHNVSDFVLLHRAWSLWSQAWSVVAEHGGILLLPQHNRHQELAQLLDTFLARGAPFANTLY